MIVLNFIHPLTQEHDLRFRCSGINVKINSYTQEHNTKFKMTHIEFLHITLNNLKLYSTKDFHDRIWFQLILTNQTDTCYKKIYADGRFCELQFDYCTKMTDQTSQWKTK